MSSRIIKCDVAVIGGGPAGLAAAVSARRNGAEKVLVIERDKEPGGVLNQCIHTGFGLTEFKEELTGPEYAEKYIGMAENSGCEIMTGTMVTEIHGDNSITAVNPDGLFKIITGAVVLAMGCRERTPGAIALKGRRPSGIYTAGMAQRFSNINGRLVGKEVVIYGSGDIGLIMARRMTIEGARVKAVIEIMPYSSGLRRNIAQCLDDFDIQLFLSTSIAEVHGKDRLTGITTQDLNENGNIKDDSEKYIPCDTLLLSVGLIPENELSEKAGIIMDPVTSGPVTDNLRMTSREGIFASGNVLHVHDIVDYVSEESKISGKYAAFYSQGLIQNTESIPVRAINGIRYVVPQKVRTGIQEKISNEQQTHQINHTNDTMQTHQTNQSGYNSETGKNEEFFLRTDRIYEDVYITIRQDNVVLKKKKYSILIPSEMVRIKTDIPPSPEGGEITLSIEREENEG